MEEAKNDNREMTPSDEPIKTEHDDVLGWEPYAKLVAKALFNPSSNDSMVYAIDGPWGSGKSSLLNLIGEQLAKLNREKKADEKYTVIVNYRPWNVALDQNAIIKEFFDVFVRTSKLGNRSFKVAAAKALLIANASLDSAVSLCKIFHRPEGILLKSLRGLVKPFVGFAKAALNDDKELSKAKEKLEKKLRKQKALRFLVIIDDLDRLNRDEIRLVVQLIKAVGNLPNVSYLLAIDWKIVAKALDGEQTGESGTGESYLSKIIQDRIPVPPVNKFRLRDLVKVSLDNIFERYNEKCDWTFQPLLRYVLMISNLREAKKYIRSIDFYAGAFGDSVDASDLAAIVAIKMLDPDLYRLIIKYRSSLLGQNFHDESNKEFNKEALATRLGKESQTYCLAVCSDLFPNMFRSIDKNDEVVTNNHLRNPEVFDRFAQMMLSDGDDPIARIVNAASLDGDAFARWCLESDNDSVVKAFHAKTLGLFNKGLVGKITSSLVRMANCGVNQSLINDCIKRMSSFFYLDERDYFSFTDGLLEIRNPAQGMEIAYRVLSLQGTDSLISDKDQLNDLFKELIDRLMKVPEDLFNLSAECFTWAIASFKQIEDYCRGLQDEKSVHRLLLSEERKETHSNLAATALKAKHYGISKMAIRKLEIAKPFIKKWITTESQPTDLTVLIPIAMKIAGVDPDTTLDGIDFYSGERVLIYAILNFPGKVEDLEKVLNQ